MKQHSITIGMDLGDKISRYCLLNAAGEVVKEGKLATTRSAMAQTFGAMKRCRIAIEVGGHSPIVANARQVRLISQSSRKDDKLDARMLARLARVDPELLRPIRHRSEEAQMDLMSIRVRAALVEQRTSLINTARGLAKSVGERMAACASNQVSVKRMRDLPAPLVETLRPLLEQIESLSAQIETCDARIEQIARERYPENHVAEASRRRRIIDRSDVRVDARRPRPFPKEPRRGMLPRSAAEAQRIGPAPARTAHHQGRRSVSAQAAGAGRASRAGMARPRYRPPALGPKAGRARRKKCEEASHRGGGA